MDRLLRKSKSLNFLQTRPSPPPKNTLLLSTIRLELEVDTMLDELDSMPRVYRYKTPTFLKTFQTTVDERTTQILNNRFTS